jgi:hypothetical protein
MGQLELAGVCPSPISRRGGSRAEHQGDGYVQLYLLPYAGGSKKPFHAKLPLSLIGMSPEKLPLPTNPREVSCTFFFSTFHLQELLLC